MKNNIDPKQKLSPELVSLLWNAADFHGHLGPFLVIGVRMGLIGLRKIGKFTHGQLGIKASLPLHVPISCIIDGLQFTTRCTVGNQKLSIKDSSSIQATFKRGTDEKAVKIVLKESKFDELTSQLLDKAVLGDEVRELAWKVAALPENELFKL
jgi:formylmethanofuran dehydrogenase subunit E